MKGYRQGDVIVAPIEGVVIKNTLTQYAKHEVKPKKGRVVLAEGEITGHAHTMPPSAARLFKAPAGGETILVVTETTVNRGDFIEGKVLETMPGGTIRFKTTDGTVMRFAPGDITIKGQKGVVVNRAYTPLTHDEHDAIPVGKGVHHVIQHRVATVTQPVRVAD